MRPRYGLNVPEVVCFTPRRWEVENPPRCLAVLKASSCKGFGDVVRASEVAKEFGIDAPSNHGPLNSFRVA